MKNLNIPVGISDFEKIRNEKADSFIYTYKSVEVGYEQRRTDGSVL